MFVLRRIFGCSGEKSTEVLDHNIDNSNKRTPLTGVRTNISEKSTLYYNRWDMESDDLISKISAKNFSDFNSETPRSIKIDNLTVFESADNLIKTRGISLIDALFFQLEMIEVQLEPSKHLLSPMQIDTIRKILNADKMKYKNEIANCGEICWKNQVYTRLNIFNAADQMDKNNQIDKKKFYEKREYAKSLLKSFCKLEEWVDSLNLDSTPNAFTSEDLLWKFADMSSSPLLSTVHP